MKKFLLSIVLLSAPVFTMAGPGDPAPHETYFPASELTATIEGNVDQNNPTTGTTAINGQANSNQMAAPAALVVNGTLACPDTVNQYDTSKIGYRIVVDPRNANLERVNENGDTDADGRCFILFNMTGAGPYKAFYSAQHADTNQRGIALLEFNP